jgi:hypothetical protein
MIGPLRSPERASAQLVRQEFSRCSPIWPTLTLAFIQGARTPWQIQRPPWLRY